MKQSLSRTNLWLVPTLCVLAALLLFLSAQVLDRAHHIGTIQLPRWINQGGASDARELLSATAGAIITTLGLILSITVLTLSIAATQFGQRMLRRYMRDRGTLRAGDAHQPDKLSREIAQCETALAALHSR